MADKRLRKRSARLSSSDPTFQEEPPRKRLRKDGDVENSGLKPGRKRQKKEDKTSSPKSSNAKGRSNRHFPKDDSWKLSTEKQLLVSLNIQDNDLHISAHISPPEEGGGKSMASGRGRKGRGSRHSAPSLQLLQESQRGQSVGSDGGSSSGSNGGNGKNLTFKNPNFRVNI